MSRLPITILLALLLLFAQHAAVTHALTHYPDNQQQDKHFPGAKACEKCAAFAELSSAVAATDVVFHAAQFTDPLPRYFFYGVAQATFSFYLSRAPPSLS